MVTDPDGTFITAPITGDGPRFTPAILPDGLLQAPDGTHSTVCFSDFSGQDHPTEVWGNHFTAQIAPEAVNQWLSRFFPRPVQLRWVGLQPSRRVKDFASIPLSFADGFPFLLVNSVSLQDLQPQQQAPSAVNITFQGQTFTGDNQQVLLEQLEMQGFRISYSCRAGLCGSCKLRLVAGEVK